MNNRFEKFASALQKGTLTIAVFSSLVGIFSVIAIHAAYGMLAAIIGGMGIAFILELILNMIFAIILQRKYYPNDQESFLWDLEDYRLGRRGDASDLYEEPGIIVSAVFGLTPEPSLIVSDSSKIFPEMTLWRKPEHRIGTFQDEDIYEWLELKGSDEKIYRFTYQGCSNKNQILEMIPGRLVLSTGIIYQVDTAINNAA